MPDYDLYMKVTVIDARNKQDAIEYVYAGLDYLHQARRQDPSPIDTTADIEDYELQDVVEIGE